MYRSSLRKIIKFLVIFFIICLINGLYSMTQRNVSTKSEQPISIHETPNNGKQIKVFCMIFTLREQFQYKVNSLKFYKM
jgi:hypothetical protein